MPDYKTATCVFCNEKFTYLKGVPKRELKKIKGRKGVDHHLSYSEDITVPCCLSCHNLLHGHAAHQNAFFKRYPKDQAPYEWAKQVVRVYYKLYEQPRKTAQALTAIILGSSGNDVEH